MFYSAKLKVIIFDNIVSLKLDINTHQSQGIILNTLYCVRKLGTYEVDLGLINEKL
jgi:hypothetical protein